MKPLFVKDLKPGMVLAQDVFLESNPTIAFLSRSTVLTKKSIARLQDGGVLQVRIKDGNPSPARPVMLATHAKVLTPAPTVGERLRKKAVATLEETFSSILGSGASVHGPSYAWNNMGGVVQQLVHTVADKEKALVNINDLKSTDEYTYHHSLSVSVLAIAIGRQMGLAAGQLNPLGLAGIMHDIGKITVPPEILKKPARLEDWEFSLMQEHAKSGAETLRQSAVGDEALWQAVLHHHEKMDGTGYPKGIKGDDIPLWSRILSVADVYDALTSNRPYRSPMQPAEALEYVMGGVGSAFDYDVVRALTQKLDLYPVGSCVELSNGQLAIVLDNEAPARPTVEILGEGRLVDLYHDRRYLSVVIRRAVPQSEIAVQAQ